MNSQALTLVVDGKKHMRWVRHPYYYYYLGPILMLPGGIRMHTGIESTNTTEPNIDWQSYPVQQLQRCL